MKVVTAKEMARLEAKAIAQGCSQAAFMEEAGKNIASAIEDLCLFKKKPLFLIAGKGNNAGDGYVAACHLLQKGYVVKAFSLFPKEQFSPLCREHFEHFLQLNGEVCWVTDSDQLQLPTQAVILDGIFGTGFSGKITGLVARVIEKINRSSLNVIAIDIPSGLGGALAVRASRTFFLGLPKTSFFLHEGWSFVGKLHAIDFGLPKTYVDQAKEEFALAEETAMAALLPPLHRQRNKYSAGYVAGFAGSKGMAGAAILAATAALKSGAGIVRLWHPVSIDLELAHCLPELLKKSYGERKDFMKAGFLDRVNAVFIGPGMGRVPKVHQLLSKLFHAVGSLPCVLDADALYYLAKNPKAPLPKHSLLTPHLGEMAALLQISLDSPPLTEKFLTLCQQYCDKKKVTLILKGAPTFIFHPHTKPMISPRGDPGMATAGAGDVLSGLLAGLLAQKLPLVEAATLGVYLHGLSGELAARFLTSYTLTASDLITHLPQAFQRLQFTEKKFPDFEIPLWHK